ncbi:MAG: TlpA disulfide reductase family protein, partial [Ferruginibacter sp.]
SDLNGKVIFINVWASWCPPCRAEMPDLEKLYQKMKDDNRIVFLFLNEDQDGNKGIDYLNKNNFSMPFYKSTGSIPEEIFKGSLPTTVVINKAGEIVMKHHGVAGYNNDKFINQLTALL